MANTRRDVELVISTQTEGSERIRALVSQIEALAKEGGEVAPEFARIADEVRRLGAQEVRIDGLQTAIQTAKATWTALKDARHEVQALDKALGDARGAGAGKDAIEVLQKALSAANRELKKTEGEWTRNKAAIDRARQSAAAAGVDVKQLAQEQARIAVASDAAASSVDALTNALNEERQAAQQQARVADEQARAAREQAEAAEVQAAALRATEQAARDVDKALSSLGIRSAAKIQSEIAGINQQLALVASEGKLSGAELDRAFAAGQKRIAALEAELKDVTSAIKDVNPAFKTLGTTAQQTNAALGRLGIRSADQIQADINAINQDLQRLASNAKVGGADFDRAFSQGQTRIAALQSGLERTADSAGALPTRLKPLAAAIGGLFAVNKAQEYAVDLARIADLYSNLQSRISLINSTTSGFNATLDDTAALALRTSSSLDGTVNLFAALARAGADLGTSQSDVLRLTETINKANQIAGQSAASADAAVVQLIQGLQSGVVRGEEFNSIMEQSPRLARAMADGLGVTLGTLREMSKQGQLTSAVVIQALQSQAAVIDQEFAKLPLTIGRALTNLTTNWTKFVGSLDKGVGASAAVATAIAALGENLQEVARAALYVGEVTVAALAVKALGAVRAYTAQLVVTTGATTALAGATNAMAAAAARAAPALRALGYGALAVEVVQLVGNLVALREEYKKQAEANENIARNADLIRERYKLISEQTGVTITSLQELDAAVEAGRIHFDNASSSWKAGANSLEVVSAAAQRTVQSTAEVAAAFQEIGKAANIDLSKVGNSANALALELARVAKSSQVASQAIGEQLPSAIEKLTGSQLAEFATTFQGALAGITSQTGLLEAGMVAVAKQAVKSLGVDVPQAFSGMRGEFAESLNQISILIRTLPALEKAGVNTGGVLRAAFSKMIDSAQTVTEIEAIESRIVALGKAGQLAAPLVAQLFDTMLTKGFEVAATLPELDKLTEKMAGLAREGKLSAEAMSRLGDAATAARKRIEDLTPGIQSVEEAFRKLGVTSKNELDRAALDAKTAFDVIRESGTATTAELKASFTAYAEKAIAANDGIVSSQLKAEATQVGLKVAADESGKIIVQTMKEAAEATNKLGEAADEAAGKIGLIEASARGAAGAVTSAWDDAGNLMEDATDRAVKSGEGIAIPWLQGAAAASRYADLAGEIARQLVREFGFSDESIRAAQQAAEQYVLTLEDLDKRSESLTNNAAQGVADLKFRLLELEGTEEEIAKARLARDQAEVQREIELLKIEAQRARLQGDTERLLQLQSEIGLLNEQLDLLEQIYRAEQRQSKGGSGGGSRSGGGGVSTGGDTTTVTRTITPTPPSGGTLPAPNINVYGVNDPEKIARQVWPQLQRIWKLNS